MNLITSYVPRSLPRVREKVLLLVSMRCSNCIGLRNCFQTTGVVPAVGELAIRSEGLEQAVRELALAVEELAAADRG